MYLGYAVSAPLVCFVADIAFQLGKLFPGLAYNNSDSWACRKVAHVCAMTMCNTLVSFVFSLYEVVMLEEMVSDQGSQSASPSEIYTVFRGFGICSIRGSNTEPSWSGNENAH